MWPCQLVFGIDNSCCIFRVFITGLDQDQTSNIYNTFGPIPRLWLRLPYEAERNRYKSDVAAIIEDMTPSKLKQLVLDTQLLSMDDAISDKIVLVRRTDPDDTESLHTIAPITPIIESMVQSRFRYLDRLEIVELYKMFARNPNLSQMAGMMFKLIGHQLMEANITLDIVPMVQLNDVPEGKPQWYSTHLAFPNPELEASRQENLKHMVPLDVKPTKVVEVGSERDPIEEDVYYILGSQEAKSSRN